MKKAFFPPLLLAGALLLFGSATSPCGYAVGDRAEDFSLKSVSTKMISLADYKDVKGYILIFTCNHCPYAQLYEQRIIDLHNKYSPKGFPVVAINPNSPLIVEEDSFEEMQIRATAQKYPFEYLFDEEQTVYPKFGATRTPHVFLLDRDLFIRYIGAIDDNPETPRSAKNRWVEKAIEAMMKGEKPNPDYTRAVGCTVKKKPEVKPAPAPVQKADTTVPMVGGQWP
ncbi:MAG: thioredoxin family protein [Lewinellaceae bacterium]|nr:thioredoxin family protein [Lewinellaceae bacterium]